MEEEFSAFNKPIEICPNCGSTLYCVVAPQSPEVYNSDPGDGKKHPAVIWAHGGFGGIDKWLWETTDQQDPGKFREAGIIVLCPSWRAENDNPGRFELFYGEVEDAAATRQRSSCRL